MSPLRVEAEPPMRMLGVQLLACEPCCLHIFCISQSWSQLATDAWTFAEATYRLQNQHTESLSQSACYWLLQHSGGYDSLEGVALSRPDTHKEWIVFWAPLTRGLGINLRSLPLQERSLFCAATLFLANSDSIHHLRECRGYSFWPVSPAGCISLHSVAVNKLETQCDCNSQSGAQCMSRIRYPSSFKTLPLGRSYLDELRGRDLLSTS